MTPSAFGRALIVGALVIVSSVASAVPALAHARLVMSTPAGGATVTEAPASVRLEFDQPIESSFGGVQVFDPVGGRVVEDASPTINDRVVEMPISAIEAAGTYTVVFRVISADGHPIEARYSFPLPADGATDDHDRCRRTWR